MAAGQSAVVTGALGLPAGRAWTPWIPGRSAGAAEGAQSREGTSVLSAAGAGPGGGTATRVRVPAGCRRCVLRSRRGRCAAMAALAGSLARPFPASPAAVAASVPAR